MCSKNMREYTLVYNYSVLYGSEIAVLMVVYIAMIGVGVTGCGNTSNKIQADAEESTAANNDYIEKDTDTDTDTSSSTPEYTTSKSGYLVKNQLGPYTYPLNAINTLNGFFEIDASKSEFVLMDNKSGGVDVDSVVSYHIAESLPTCLERSEGEELLIIGSEWGGRSDRQKSDMNIDIYNATLIGYGSSYMVGDLPVDDIDSINSISISAENDDYTQVNQALSGSDVIVIE